MQHAPLFSLPPDTEVIAAGEVLRRRNEVLTSVLHLDTGRVLRGVLDDGVMRHQLGAVEGPFWLDAASALMGLPFPVDMVADTRLQVRRVPIEVFRQSLDAMPASARGLLLDMAQGYPCVARHPLKPARTSRVHPWNWLCQATGCVPSRAAREG